MGNCNKPTVQLTRSDSRGPIVFVCEHASNNIPPQYESLGLSQTVIDSHAGWDIGALELSEILSERFDSPLITSTVSRLVYDCNRAPDSTSAMVINTEAGDVPGNHNLSTGQRQQRVDSIYHPFTDQLSSLLDQRQSQGIETVVVTMHSFTPTFHGQPREVEIGILHDSDSRFADELLSLSAKHSGYKFERNQPYGPDDDVTHTLKKHAISRQLRHVMLEVRNDLLLDTPSIKQIANLLFSILNDALQPAGPGPKSTNKGPM